MVLLGIPHKPEPDFPVQIWQVDYYRSFIPANKTLMRTTTWKALEESTGGQGFFAGRRFETDRPLVLVIFNVFFIGKRDCLPTTLETFKKDLSFITTRTVEERDSWIDTIHNFGDANLPKETVVQLLDIFHKIDASEFEAGIKSFFFPE